VSPELETLLQQAGAATPEAAALRRRFGLACAERIAHLLEEPQVLSCLQDFRGLVQAGAGDEAYGELARRAAALANRHPGSRSLDGVGHAAVSATYAVARAIAGQARQAAEYAAYAAVYGQGGYGATSDPESFAPEVAWQASVLAALLAREGP